MQNVASAIMILVCVAIGYVLEPIFFSSDQEVKPIVEKTPEAVGDETLNEEVSEEAPEVVKEETTPQKVDLTPFTQADFPETVTLKVSYSFVDAESGVTMNLKQGIKVKPLRFEDGCLVIKPLGDYPVEGKIDVADTDFIALAEPKMKARLSASSAEEPATDDAVAQDGSDDVFVEEPIADDQKKDSPEVVIEEPETSVEAPVEDSTAEVVSKPLDSSTIIKLMKKSILAKKVSEFSPKQAVAFKAGEPLTWNGKSYQTGVVTFKAETILGVQEHDALALIENGAVVKWLWAKTKEEMH